MFVRTRLRQAPAKLKDVFARHGRIQAEFPQRPVRRDADRRVGREPVPLGLTVEIHADRDVAAAVDVDMAVPVDFKNGKRQPDIDGGLFVRAVVDLIRFVQRLDAFADKDVAPIRLVPDDLKANQNVPKRVLGGGHRHLGLATRGVNKMLDFLAFHSCYLDSGGRRKTNPLRAAEQSANVYLSVWTTMSSETILPGIQQNGHFRPTVVYLDNRLRLNAALVKEGQWPNPHWDFCYAIYARIEGFRCGRWRSSPTSITPMFTGWKPATKNRPRAKSCPSC